jgi:hypothetical protein
MILSDTKILRQHFDKGAVYTDNTSNSIAAAVKAAIERQADLLGEVRELRQRLENEGLDRMQALEQTLVDLDARPRSGFLN